MLSCSVTCDVNLFFLTFFTLWANPIPIGQSIADSVSVAKMNTYSVPELYK
jgi:hypothetical protein